ncbi:Hypothetical predicted protein [Octopus vulgaris]|uniref:Uncharacterized protein n=1 Tax=Octopus vulgaris TaxID=6645 RepID=A0AA36B2R9_OCTVU|nr:Hypothetical predicted protein [Octopus vulgaris]
MLLLPLPSVGYEFIVVFVADTDKDRGGNEKTPNAKMKEEEEVCEGGCRVSTQELTSFYNTRVHTQDGTSCRLLSSNHYRL